MNTEGYGYYCAALTNIISIMNDNSFFNIVKHGAVALPN